MNNCNYFQVCTRNWYPNFLWHPDQEKKKTEHLSIMAKLGKDLGLLAPLSHSTMALVSPLSEESSLYKIQTSKQKRTMQATKIHSLLFFSIWPEVVPAHATFPTLPQIWERSALPMKVPRMEMLSIVCFQLHPPTSKAVESWEILASRVMLASSWTWHGPRRLFLLVRYFLHSAD